MVYHRIEYMKKCLQITGDIGQQSEASDSSLTSSSDESWTAAVLFCLLLWLEPQRPPLPPKLLEEPRRLEAPRPPRPRDEVLSSGNDFLAFALRVSLEPVLCNSSASVVTNILLALQTALLRWWSASENVQYRFRIVTSQRAQLGDGSYPSRTMSTSFFGLYLGGYSATYTSSPDLFTWTFYYINSLFI